MLKGKKILLGICGGIAAYKSLSLIRLLKKAGAEVRVCTTQNALYFVTPLSIETLSKTKLYSDTFASPSEYSTEHIALSEWADVMVIAPATANIIGKFANGIADDALSTLFLAFKKTVFIAPAMNTAMYEHPILERNIETLKKIGLRFIEATSGELACGDFGKGRMAEPEEMERVLFGYFAAKYFGSPDLRNKKILVNAGPTYEAIDPVRFIGNRSSGLMGYCLAEAFAQYGASVSLISGPSALQIHHTAIECVRVENAAQMKEACLSRWADVDTAVLAAAVADYTPLNKAEQKIKKSAESICLNLVKTTDILAQMGKTKKEKHFLVGFALETENELAHAQDKLKKKNADLIVLNSLRDSGAGFEKTSNKICLVEEGKTEDWELDDKQILAFRLAAYVAEKMKGKS